MKYMTLINTVGGVISSLMIIISFVVLVVKPIRKRFVEFIKTESLEENMGFQKQIRDSNAVFQKQVMDGSAEMQRQIGLISNGSRSTLRHLILSMCESCIGRGYIKTIEKMDLIDMYTDYAGLNGDQYCTGRYELALELEERNI